jgi:hypothetical protein
MHANTKHTDDVIVVTGASGNVGRRVAERLLATGHRTGTSPTWSLVCSRDGKRPWSTGAPRIPNGKKASKEWAASMEQAHAPHSLEQLTRSRQRTRARGVSENAW